MQNVIKYSFNIKSGLEGERIPHGIVVNVLDWDIVVSVFKLQYCYYIHFHTNIFRKSMNPLILPSYGGNSTTTVLQVWLLH